MKKSQSDKMTGNQVVFRGRNEKINKNIREFNETAQDEDQHPVDMKNGEFLLFYCECSDEKCTLRIKVSFTKYEKYHADRSTFVVKPNHVVSEIEDVIYKNSEYWVVKKHERPLQTTQKLRSSGLRHTSSQ